MSDPFTTPQPRRRRSDRHRQAQPLQREEAIRADYPQEEAPLPLGGYDAAAPMQEAGRAQENVQAAIDQRSAMEQQAAAEQRAPVQMPPRREPETRVYEENSYYPPRKSPYPSNTYHDGYGDEPHHRRWPWVLLSLVLVAALLLAGAYYIVPNIVPKDSTGVLGAVRGVSVDIAGIIDDGLKLVGLKKEEPPRLLKFDTPLPTVQTGVRTVFTITADKAVEDVRILDEVGMEISGVKQAVDSPYNTTWTVAVILGEPQTLTLTAGMKSGGIWYQTDRALNLVVAEPTPTPSPTPSPSPTPTLPPATPEPSATPAETPQAWQQTAPSGAPETAAAPDAVPHVVAAPIIQTTPASLEDLLPRFTPIPETAASQADPLPAEEQADAAPDAELADDAAAAEGEDTAALAADETADAAPGMEDAAGEDAAANALGAEDMAADAQAPEDAATEGEPAQAAEPMPAEAVARMPELPITPADSQLPERFKWIENAYQGSKKLSDYTRSTPIDMQGGELYTYYPGGVFTFRGDGMRRNAAFGKADMPLDQLSILWQTPLGSLRTADSGTLYGTGWTGQPAIVKWSVEVRQMMNLEADKQAVKALKEVIFAAQDGKVYFLDLNDGQPTRAPIEVGFPLKGSVTVDPTGRPLIAFGQAISKLPNRTGEIGYFIYNLIDQSKLEFINGRKSKTQLQFATNGAFDGTGLIDRSSDTLVIAGENGLLYTVALNSVFDFKDQKTITIDPEIIYLRSKGNQADTTVSMESSVAMYGPTAFMADKQGLVRAVDTTTMKTLWVFDAGDNTDATLALDLEEDNSLALYTGTTVHARTRKAATAAIRRLDALTGLETWKVDIKAKYDAAERGGVKASPVVGQGEIGHLVIFTVNMTEEGGTILALDKQTGSTVWQVPLPKGSVSSPVAVYNSEGRARIIQADSEGMLYLIDGLTGQVIHTLALGGPVEGSPAVYNDVLVISTNGKDNNYMYGIRLE